MRSPRGRTGISFFELVVDPVPDEDRHGAEATARHAAHGSLDGVEFGVSDRFGVLHIRNVAPLFGGVKFAAKLEGSHQRNTGDSKESP
jgi:hypothetical protein